MTGQTPVATATAAVAAALYQHQMQALQLCRQRLDASTSSSSALTNWNSAPEANLRKGKALFRPAVCLSVKVCLCLSIRLSVDSSINQCVRLSVRPSVSQSGCHSGRQSDVRCHLVVRRHVYFCHRQPEEQVDNFLTSHANAYRTCSTRALLVASA